MHSRSTKGISTLIILDSDELLRILLRSIPSAQCRSDLTPVVEGMVDELLPLPQRTLGSIYSQASIAPAKILPQAQTQNGARKSNEGMFSKLGSLLTRIPFITAKVEVESSPPLSTNEDEHFLRTTNAILEASGSTQLEPIVGLSRDALDEAEEMGVEFMVVAEKCIPASPSISSDDSCSKRNPAHRKRSALDLGSPTRRKRSTLSRPSPPSTPPRIQRRRQSVAKKGSPTKRKQSVPGFN